MALTEGDIAQISKLLDEKLAPLDCKIDAVYDKLHAEINEVKITVSRLMLPL